MTNIPNCTFCKIVTGSLPADILYQDEKSLVVLALDWTVKGHTLVIWKEHHINASDLSPNDFAHFAQVFQKTETILLNHLQKDRAVNLKSGGFVEHFHFHIYPVSTQTPWSEIDDMINIRVKYQPTDQEKSTLISALKSEFSQSFASLS